MTIYSSTSGEWFSNARDAGPGATPVEIPSRPTKADVLRLLNTYGRGVRAPETPDPGSAGVNLPKPRDPAPRAPTGTRWRVYCRGQFVGSTRAENEAEACSHIAAELEARQAPE